MVMIYCPINLLLMLSQPNKNQEICIMRILIAKVSGHMIFAFLKFLCFWILFCKHTPVLIHTEHWIRELPP